MSNKASKFSRKRPLRSNNKSSSELTNKRINSNTEINSIEQNTEIKSTRKSRADARSSLKDQSKAESQPNTEIKSTRKSRAEARHNRKPKNFDLTVRTRIKAEDLKEKLVITVKKPSKRLETFCSQLRFVLRPNSLHKIKDISIKQKDVEKFADEFKISHVLYAYESQDKLMLDVTNRRNKQKYFFEVVNFDEELKSYPNTFYAGNPLVSVSGSNKEMISLFSKMHRENDESFKRVIHFDSDDDLVHIRHFCYKINDDISKYKVSLKEIGPKIDLKFINKQKI